MSIISLIAAVDENFGLGKNNQLLCHLPADLAHFKKNTMGKPIIMGRKTFESIGKPLPGRLNIVLSKKVPKFEGSEVYTSLTSAMERLKGVAEVMIIGGAELFGEALPLANRIYLTRIHHQFDADVFFPHFCEKSWHCLEEVFHPADEKNQYSMTFCVYEMVKDNEKIVKKDLTRQQG